MTMDEGKNPIRQPLISACLIENEDLARIQKDQVGPRRPCASELRALRRKVLSFMSRWQKAVSVSSVTITSTPQAEHVNRTICTFQNAQFSEGDSSAGFWRCKTADMES